MSNYEHVEILLSKLEENDSDLVMSLKQLQSSNKSIGEYQALISQLIGALTTLVSYDKNLKKFYITKKVPEHETTIVMQQKPIWKSSDTSMIYKNQIEYYSKRFYMILSHLLDNVFNASNIQVSQN